MHLWEPNKLSSVKLVSTRFGEKHVMPAKMGSPCYQI